MRRLVFLLGVLVALGASAQSYPSKPVRLIVGFPAGGPADIFGRALAQGMASELGQPVVVENVAGVGGVLGVDRAAKAPPDGYTLCINSASPLVIAPYSLSKIPYDVKRDFAFITLVVRVPEVVAVHPSLPVNSLAELVSHAKLNPGKVNFGSAGSGSITHLAGELLKAEAKIDIVHVPYKGAAPAVNDLLGGQVQMGIFDVPILLGHIRSGKLKALALTSSQRAASLPEVATTVELGYPNVNSDNWYGLVAAHSRRGGRGAQVKGGRGAVCQSRRHRFAGNAGRVPGIHRRRAGEVVEDRSGDRLQGVASASSLRLMSSGKATPWRSFVSKQTSTAFSVAQWVMESASYSRSS
jgi:tripartite-type tricarboxylate transporter receptor subunit TctC